MSVLNKKFRLSGQSRLFKISLLFLSLHIALILALGSITALAPDESGYAEIFGTLYSSDFTFDGRGGWGAGNVTFLRILYLPAKIFSILGFSDLISIRLLSLLCAYTAVYLLVKQNRNKTLLGTDSFWWLAIAFFTPSIFLWTSLGLRESFIFLWLVSIFHFTSEIVKVPSWRNFILLTLSSAALCLTKDYLYIFVVISYISTLLLLWIKSRKLERSHLKLITFVLLPLLFFPSITAGFIRSGQSLIAQTLQELIDQAKANPGKIVYGSAGFGNLTHIGGELFQVMAGVKLIHVPYKSAGPAINDLVGGQIPLMFGPSPVLVPMVQAGRLRGLAYTGLKRSSQLPNLPTADELGVKGYEATGWYGIYGPRNLPRAIVEQLNRAVNKIIDMPETRERFNALNLEAVGGSPDQFAEFLKGDLKKYADIARKAGIQPE